MGTTFLRSSKILSKNTTGKLFQILDQVDPNEKGEIIKDWIVRYGGNNPIFEEHDDPDLITILLLVRNETVEHWKKVFVVGDSFGMDTPNVKMTHIADTKWWYLKITRPRGCRLHYMISPNDLGTLITDETRSDRYQNFILDTRNPTVLDEGMMKHSVITTPGFQDDNIKSVDDIEFSKIYMRKKLQGNRSAQYCVIGKQKSPEKLLIVHDGTAFSKIMEGHKIIAKGVDEGRWPSMAILSLNSPFSERVREYGGKYGYPKYFNEVIIPTVEHQIGKSFEPEDIILHGSSLGAWGLLDVINHEHVASNVILHSCPFWWPDEDHSKYIREMPPVDHLDRIYIDVGRYETGRIPLSTYDSNRKFVSKLEEVDGIEFMAREFLMGHRYAAWAWALPSALDFIIHGKKNYDSPTGRELQYKDTDDLKGLEELKKEVEAIKEEAK